MRTARDAEPVGTRKVFDHRYDDRAVDDTLVGRSFTPMGVDVGAPTKLQAPLLRSRIVSRPRLVDRLDEALGVALTVMSAPAGYGKTTAVAEWAIFLDA